MELADVERLVSRPDSLLVGLRRTLLAAGLDGRFLARLARAGERLDDPLRAPMRAWNARRRPEPAAILARLFVLHDPVAGDDVARALSHHADLPGLGALVDAGLLEETSAGCVSRARLAFAGEFAVFGDRAATGDGVPPLNGVTVALARAALPGHALDAALDLGCGAGALALTFTACARRVVATDVSARAVAWTRFNARLNGVAVDVRQGDRFQPVRGERFDRIVSQPPFVARRRDAAASTFAHGGERGDELALRVIAEAAEHLTPGGRAVVLADWPLVEHDPIEERVRRALRGADAGAGAGAGASAGAGAFVLSSPGKDLDEYCTSLAVAEYPRLDADFAAAACAQRDHFERLGVRGVAQALIVVVAAEAAAHVVVAEAGAHAGVLVVPVRHGHDAPVTHDDVERVAARHALLAAPAPDSLLDARLRLPRGARLVEQPSVQGTAPAVIVQLPAGRPEWPVVLTPRAAAALRAIDASPSVLEAVEAAARREGVAVRELTRVFDEAARDALAKGALDVLAANGANGANGARDE